MMKYKVKMTDYASSQMEETAAYILRLSASRTVARRWLSKLRKEILSLDEMPLRYVLTDEEPWRTKGIHKMVVDNFLVSIEGLNPMRFKPSTAPPLGVDTA